MLTLGMKRDEVIQIGKAYVKLIKNTKHQWQLCVAAPKRIKIMRCGNLSYETMKEFENENG